MNLKDSEEKNRVQEVVEMDDSFLINQQYILFLIYLITIGLALSLKLLSHGLAKGDQVSNLLQLNSSAFGFFVSLSLLLSVFLPSVATRLVKQRRSLG